MPFKIVLLGKEEKNFHFIESTLHQQEYHFAFFGIEILEKTAPELTDANLIILDSVPYAESDFSQFSCLRENSQLAHIPLLALVKESPSRLRHRLIRMGINDYLTIPFDRLDLRVRIRNLLPSNNRPLPGEVSAADESQGKKALRSLNHLYQKLNNNILSPGKENFLDSVLESLGKLCRADAVLLFEAADKEQLVLKNAYPDYLKQEGCQLHVADMPSLVKAVRLQEPTVLNMSSEENPFVVLLNSFFNLKVKSFIVYPIVIQKKTRSVLCMLRTARDKFGEFDFLLVRNFAHFIIHSHILNRLRKKMNGDPDEQVWQFYFEFLDQVVNQLSFGILVIGNDRRIKYLNDNAAQLLKVVPRDVMYRPLAEILSKEMVDDILKSAEDSPLAVERPELQLESVDGRKIVVGFSVQEFNDQINRERGYIVSMKDITQSKELQEEMRRVDRLASLGVMASGIAHEIRNPLAGIKAMAQTFEEELEADDPKGEYVQRIIRLVNRLDELLRTLFSYARPPKPNRQFCRIEDILADVTSLVRQKVREHKIKLSESVRPDLPEVLVDPAQIQQVLVNLLLNSIEAINNDGEIDISIKARDKEHKAPDNFPAAYFDRGDTNTYVEITIKDNGCGISSENLKHIFNPFFTTKTFGTGLGLSIVYQIVKENEGLIHFESEVDKGTICYLYLPARKDSK